MFKIKIKNLTFPIKYICTYMYVYTFFQYICVHMNVHVCVCDSLKSI